MECKCTISFENPFWVGIFERLDQGYYSVARHVFGSEPSDVQVFDFIINHYRLQYSQPVAMQDFPKPKVNFKRRQREARRATQETGIGTKAQQVLKAEFERNKHRHQQADKADREALAEYKLNLRKIRKKEKHRGR